MSTLEPRSVPARSCLEWLREGAEVAREGWVLNLASLGGVWVLSEILPWRLADTLGLLLSPAFCVWMVAIAAGTDERMNWRQIVSATRSAMLRALCAGVLLVTVVFVMAMVARQGLGDLNESMPLPAADLPPRLGLYVFPVGSSMLIAFGFGMVLTLLVTIPLMVLFPHLQAGEAMYLSLRASDLNWVLLPLAICLMVLVGAAALLSGATAFLIIPWASGAAYVACRHIFLGQSPKRRVAAAPARASGREGLAAG